MADRIKIPGDLVQVDQSALDKANEGIKALKTNVDALSKSFNKIKGRNADSIKQFANEMKAVNEQTQSFTKATAQNTEKVQENNKVITSTAKSYLQFKESNEAISKVQAQNSEQVKSLTTRLSKLSEQFKALDPAIDKDGKQLRVLSGELRRTQKEIDLVNKSTANTRKQFKAAEGSYNALVKKNKDLNIQLKALPGGFNRANKAAEKLKNQIAANTIRLKRFDAALNQNFRNVGNYSSALRGATANLSTFATGLGLTVIPLFILANGVRNAIGILRNFEKENAVLAGVLNKTRDEIKELTESAIELGSITARTSTEVTGLQIAYARLGFSQAEVLQLTKATISGSIALNAELADTATLVGAVVRTFDALESSDTQRIIDSLTRVTQKSSLSFESLATALPKVAGAANALGFSLEKVLSDLAIAQDVTQDASIAGTSLRNIYIELAKSGLSYDDALDQVSNSQDKLTTAVEKFGVRASIAALGLANNRDRVSEVNEALLKAAGTAEKVEKEQLATLNGRILLLTSAWEGFVQSINEGDGVITNSLSSITDSFTLFLNLLSEGSAGEAFATLMNPVIATIAKTRLEVERIGREFQKNKQAQDLLTKSQFLYNDAVSKGNETFDEFVKVYAEAYDLDKVRDIKVFEQVLRFYNKTIKKTGTETDKIVATSGQLKKKLLDLFNVTSVLAPEMKDLSDELERIRREVENIDFGNAFINEIDKVLDKKKDFDSLVATIILGDDPESVKREQKKALDDAFKVGEEFREKQRQRIEATQLAGFEIADSIGQAIFDNGSIRREEELLEIEESFARKIAAAEGNTQRQKQLERDLDRERKRIQSEQAKADKKNAVFSVLINTARGITAALTSTPPNVPLSIAIGAIGAVQLGVVEAAEIPSFAKGTDNAPGGPVLINEAGKRELVITPTGQALVYDTKSPVLTDQIPKGSTIIPDDIGDLTGDYLKMKYSGDKKITDEIIKVHTEKETRIIEKQAQIMASQMSANDIGKAVAENLPPYQYWEMNNGELQLTIKKGANKSRILNESRGDRA